METSQNTSSNSFIQIYVVSCPDIVLLAIYYLMKKYESLKMFKEFISLVENQTWNKIKIFMFNNGWEYIFNDFINFRKKEVIKKDIILPYIP